VLKVISREDGVDGELSSESAKVAAKRSEVSQARRSSRWPINSRKGEHDRLRAHESGENLLESRSDDDFVDGSGLPASRGSSLVDLGESLTLLRDAIFLHLVELLREDLLVDLRDLALSGMQASESFVAIRPATGRGVLAAEEGEETAGNEEDGGDDEGDPPGGVRSVTEVKAKRVVDGGHLWHGR
jgi:hypothetical protein